MMADQTKIQMTVAEYEALPDSRHPIQLIEGELVELPMPTPRHQRISRRLLRIIEGLRLDGEVLYSPLPVFLDTGNVFEPDLIWLAPESQAFVSLRGIEGAPELVVEILSPSTARYDRKTKFGVYEKHGAREYWLVDPERRQVEVWVSENGKFTLLGTFNENQSFDSSLLQGTVDLTTAFPPEE